MVRPSRNAWLGRGTSSGLGDVIQEAQTLLGGLEVEGRAFTARVAEEVRPGDEDSRDLRVRAFKGWDVLLHKQTQDSV